MPRFTTEQVRFTQGELDPIMLSRTDIDPYYGALSKATNIFTVPQGGFKRRPGLEHIDRVLGGNLTKVSTTSTTPDTGPIGTTNPYVSHHEDAGSLVNIGVIYLNGASLSASSSDEFFIQASVNNSQWVTFGDKILLTDSPKDFSRRVHGSYRYVRLVRIGDTDIGGATVSIDSLEIATENGLSGTRCINFEFNIDQTYKMVLTDKNIAIYQGTSYLIDIYVDLLTDDMLSNINWETSADTLLIFHPDVQTITVQRMGDNDVWSLGNVSYVNIPSFAFSGITTSNPTGSVAANFTQGDNITITGTGTSFTSSFVGQYINYTGANVFGRILVKSVSSPTILKGTVIIELSRTTAVSQGDWELESGYEPIWSPARGYPRVGRFHQGHLAIDGGKSRPSVLYLSKVNDFFNFDFGTGLDDEAIGPLTGGFNEIVSIYPGRNLMIFTSNEEYIIPQTFGDAITPTTAVISKQSSIGSERGFRPQEIEGGVMYVQREGASIQEFIYDDGQQAFNNNFVSLLSSHLIRGPVDFSSRKATSTEEGAYLLLARSDGSLTVANILRSQGIASFVNAQTEGKFKSCAADVSDMYFVVEREIEGQAINWLERFNDDHYMDASTRLTSGLPTNVISDLNHLNGKECRVLADGALLENETPESGSVTIDRNAIASVEIGLNFLVEVKDLPAATQIQGESTLVGRKVNISEVSLRLMDTSGISVNNKRVSFRGFGPVSGGSPLDIMPTMFTGVKRLMGFRGWAEDAQITITQTDPLPMTVLGIKKRINT